jgi:glutathione synthase/RimK-type ligase-like ATP-grasp enzyme
LSVLIVTVKGDETALKVCAALRIAGERADIWYTSDPMEEAPHSFSIIGRKIAFAARPFFEAVERYDTIWLRRIYNPFAVPEFVHPNDKQFVDKVRRHYASTMWAGLERITALEKRPIRWVNSPSSMRSTESKAFQLSAAQLVGFKVPDTIISNDAHTIRDFVGERPEGVIRKSLIPFWWNENGRLSSSETTHISVDELPSDRILQAYPEIYQSAIHKVSELRMFFVGDEVFCYHFAPLSNDSIKIDWRSYHHLGSQIEILGQVDDALIGKCVELLRICGVTTASIEVCFDQGGDVLFLEINQAGQFLWMEYCGKRVLRGMAEYLAGKRLSYLHDKNIFQSVSESEVFLSLKNDDAQRKHIIDEYLFESS